MKTLQSKINQIDKLLEKKNIKPAEEIKCYITATECKNGKMIELYTFDAETLERIDAKTLKKIDAEITERLEAS